MITKLRSAAEDRFAALTRREETAMSSVKTELEETREKTDRLRALRLSREAKEASDKAQAADDKAAKLALRRRRKSN